MLSLNYNGKILNADAAFIRPDNRSFRYGEGLFETIRLHKGKIPLWEKHWNRLSTSLPQLYFEVPKHFSSAHLHDEILKLAAKNKCMDAARVRITIFKGEGGLWELPTTSFNYLIQGWPLEKKEFEMNENGLDLGVFEAGRKACDAFANLKTNNYQLYALAAQYAKQQKWNEAVVLNQHGSICDTTIANVFFSKNGVIHTPQLSEGCVEGVMRKSLIESLTSEGFAIVEGTYSAADLKLADEIFLTNAFYGIRWVKQFEGKEFSCKQSIQFFHAFVKPLFP
jgi:branched-chain amino acid aminotransferase